jgi:SAM-dependent methyltransferase
MDPRSRSPYPAAAPGWMIGPRGARVLDLGSGTGAFARMLVDDGHEVFGVDRDLDHVVAMGQRLETGLHVAARVEALPFLACNFDVVTASQSLHRFAPGLALSEIARVLKPGGHLAVAYNTRDDTVPWVRRLIALMRRADPHSATGDFGVEAVNAVSESPYFGTLQSRSFRNWVPISRAGLVSMVERRPSVQRLDQDQRGDLLREVAALYDSSARPPEPLLLPFRATCWRAVVDHSQLAATEYDLDALQIRV